jgi:hypothetical protein
LGPDAGGVEVGFQIERAAKEFGMANPPAKQPVDWATIGALIGILTAVVVFFGAWIYCMSEYGFLFGFGLGWLPAGILAAIVGWIMRYIWPAALALLTYILIKAS